MKLFQTEPTKTAKCRWCNSVFEYREDQKPELPLMCWKCAEATLAKYASEPPRQRERKLFFPLN